MRNSSACNALLWKRWSSTRISSRNIPLDLNLCSSNPQLIFSHLQSRCDETNLKDDVLKLAELRTLRNGEIVASNEAKRKKHVLSDQIGRLLAINSSKAATGTETEEEIRCKALKSEVEELNRFIHLSGKTLETLNEEIKRHFMLIPNLLNDLVPDGKEEADNVVVSEWGTETRKMGGEYQWHDDIGHLLGGMDTEAAVRMSGTRFSVLKGHVAKLERALSNYFLDYFSDLLSADKQYEEVSVPLLVTRSTLEGTGRILHD
jgi:seryl-tRNA synthetase